MQSEKVDGKFNQGNRRDSLLALSGPLVVEVVSLQAAANCTPGAMEYHQYGGSSICLMQGRRKGGGGGRGGGGVGQPPPPFWGQILYISYIKC